MGEKQMVDKCKYCKNIIEGNPQIVLQKLTMLGYQDFDFCNLKCFIKYFEKKYWNKLGK